MSLKVTVEANGFSTTVLSLEELFNEIKQYDPDVFVQVIFHNTELKFEEFVSCTVDP